ncbi:putative late blight resistance protein homolog r1a-6 [Phtheirospermum japonicum]|uniref:Putative late blight resistance protein homolog r1a-6 n=1 Tax=Phtheirospermum japonicum TaxID=374723 RepID=A0A830D273_9LAMI|nr:putative late blight resistance protein homolog r1a-6 [Phtheirospermum japonicum]
MDEKTVKIQNDDDDHQLLHKNHSILVVASSSSLSRSPTSKGPNTMVGFEDVLIEVLLEKLTGQQSRCCQILPIVGMGGIGKTTLAKTIYVKPVIVEHFDFRGWATISQECNSKKTISGRRESLSQMREHELGDTIYKSLFGRRYLIVMDDIWIIEAWDKVKMFFPENNDGSAIMLTTRLSNLASQLSGSDDVFKMKFLDENKSWNLFCMSVLGEECCPLELEDIGKKIVKNCKGLPLSLVVVGGLLAKSKQIREYWLYIAKNLNSIVSLKEDERCFRVLRLNYNQLPVHLKPCFLYMGMYPEDSEIRVPEIMKLWVAEGFLKPIKGKCLEVVAEEYLHDLIDRNLVLVSLRGRSGKIKYCKIHDLLLDLCIRCIREAQQHNFLYVSGKHNLNSPQAINTQRRIVVSPGTEREVIGALPSASLLRSLTFNDSGSVSTFFNNRLLRVWNGGVIRSNYYLKCTRGIVNCQYIDSLRIHDSKHIFSSLVCLLWNLQTLIIMNVAAEIATSEIWKMSQLRHVKIRRVELLDPPAMKDEGDDFVLGSLQTLRHVMNFQLREEVVKRIPTIKKLKLIYDSGIGDLSSYCLHNLVLLVKLESLSCCFFKHEGIGDWNFPGSLKKLTLRGTRLEWKEIGTKIGSLPHLQVLKLSEGSFVGAERETVEGQFQSLKYLRIHDCKDLIHWRTESTHFPCLEHLRLSYLTKLKEIPLDIGEIPTLESIELDRCSDSAIIPAKEIINEQKDLGNEGLQVRVVLNRQNKAMESLASLNFQVEIIR